ncbi:LuxR C-terminal-related transcriptional regulator [Mycobacterium sp. TY814]|uniref:helix-turn-helix transcriptional regulator n=1 Tax=unclassified Mycobacterium TaxID=2642494 RepID=UPI0027429C02|nr:LuxR C-terminal-related transcriptional regulator [Mycobacterium sp. TY814]MDP7723166.1 LuxR C-terminal-related transcriptional regulator [Mycobacterium sp. TY814]
MTPGTPNLPTQLTSFVGRGPQLATVGALVADHRIVTLTGAGGVGKTRLAVEKAGELSGDFPGGLWYVDLASVVDPEQVPAVVMRALGIPDPAGHSTTDAVIHFIGNRKTLVLLDNCEHLLDATAALVSAALSRCPALTVLATSREPIGVPGEVTWRVPSLSLTDEAIALFKERARLVDPEFEAPEDNTVADICRRLDGVPLAIELAAARVRSLTLTDILEGLRDRFRLLTGGARTAVRRQQTLRASVDWSYELLTEPERTIFRRLAVFVGGFDLAAVRSVSPDIDGYGILELLSSLVDKSLVTLQNHNVRTRYQLLETMRQYAQEKLAESGEADRTRQHHRDHYAALAADLDAVRIAFADRVDEVVRELANLRAAFEWSRGSGAAESAVRIASGLQPVWLGHAEFREGRSWLDAALESPLPPALRARALADAAMLNVLVGVADSAAADESAAVAGRVNDPELVAWTLVASAASHAFDPAFDQTAFAEAVDAVREQGKPWRLVAALVLRAHVEYAAGRPDSMRLAAEEGRDLAEAIGDRYGSRACRWQLGLAQMMSGDLVDGVAQFRQLRSEADIAADRGWAAGSAICLSRLLTYSGDVAGAIDVAQQGLAVSPDVGGFLPGFAHAALATAHLAAGDVAAAASASDAWRGAASAQPRTASIHSALIASVLLARGELAAARVMVDDAVATTRGWHRATALAARAHIAYEQGEFEQAGRDAHDALAEAAAVHAWLGVADALECLAVLTADKRQACRLLGAATALRARTGETRFAVYQAAYDELVAKLRQEMPHHDFAGAWAEGQGFSAAEIIAYAQRGRGQRRRSTVGWDALTPTERDIVVLVGDGIANKEIAAQLFISPRTVQTHLTHAYAKLGVTSRAGIIREAARHRR